ncbi:MAG: proline--tRNA ligase [Clostridiales Family XIII bacterium]|jgi:prolyl-tRNA synthetase|nr:proline--tRNA ligase [Clostridiales Family XIII bacterium]
MRLSKMHFTTLREAPSDAEIPSHVWLLRAGMIRKSVAGVYNFMTFGWRTVRKIEQIVREEMDAAGAQEIITSPVQPAELWHESGRWQVYGPELWRLKDRHGREFALGPTAEEVFTDIVRNEISSYRQLPRNLYQIQLKYRDEARPRYGLMRSREFIMKDGYSFDADPAGLDESYAKMREAYTKIFTRCGLDFRPVAADNGAIGGSGSEEFQALCDYGESDIVHCACGYAATTDQAAGVDAPAADGAADVPPMEEVSTPGTKTIEAVADFLGVPQERTLKALLFVVYEDLGAGGASPAPTDGGTPRAATPTAGYAVKEYVAAFVRGDRALNMVKLRAALGGVAEHLIEFADEARMGAATGSVAGFTGPVGLHDCRIVADSEVPGLGGLVAGACKEGYHAKNVLYGRDWTADTVADLKLVGAGDPCPQCGAPLAIARGIEVGQIFQLGTKYSDALGAFYRDDNQQEHPIWMGCYGIGVTRTMAAVVEQHHDDDGIIWPLSVAPFHAIVCPVKNGDAEVAAIAEGIYEDLLAAGVEALLDDREERPGVKFKDADMLGIPLRITVGKKAAEGIVEYKPRAEKQAAEVSPAEAVRLVTEAVKGI